jgi:hypothetical protein
MLGLQNYSFKNLLKAKEKNKIIQIAIQGSQIFDDWKFLFTEVFQ